LNYKGIIYYPKFFDDICEVIGKQRWASNKRNRSKNENYNRGSKENEIKIDSIGVLCEMIALYYLTNKEKKFVYSVLLSKNPQCKNDITVIQDDIRTGYEVKAVTGNHARVNKNSHEKKPCNFYLFVRPTKELNNDYSNGAYWWTEQYSEVNTWDYIEGNYGSPYYQKQIIIEAMDVISDTTKQIEAKNK